jgi:hypothetical protein
LRSPDPYSRPRARELAVAPNGDLFIGTGGKTVELLPDAQADQPGLPYTFAHFDDGPAAGAALGDDALYVGTPFGI